MRPVDGVTLEEAARMLGTSKSTRAAAIVGMTGAGLRRLRDDDKIPLVVHRDGTRLHRRLQLEVVAQARGAISVRP